MVLVLLQGIVSGDLGSVIDGIYNNLVPMADQLITAGRAIAGTGALLFISSRIWRSLVNLEPINFYPLFRPLVIGFVIILYPSFISLLNDGLLPLVAASNVIVANASLYKAQSEVEAADVDNKISKFKRESLGSAEMSDKDGVIGENGGANVIINDMKFNEIQISSKQFIYELLQFLYQAVPLLIATLRTFLLIILVIVGPISLGLSIWGGFTDTIKHWIKGYVVIFLWLPIANIFNAIISQFYSAMLPKIVSNIASQGDAALGSSDTAFMCLMLIAVVGYLSVPYIANYLIRATGFSKS